MRKDLVFIKILRVHDDVAIEIKIYGGMNAAT